jgi:hypothetical protein
VLTGKHNGIKQAPSGRFKDNAMYADRFWKETYLNLDKVYAMEQSTAHRECV